MVWGLHTFETISWFNTSKQEQERKDRGNEKEGAVGDNAFILQETNKKFYNSSLAMAARLSSESRLDKVKVWEETVASRWGVDGFDEVT
jgi:hypothetical protein